MKRAMYLRKTGCSVRDFAHSRRVSYEALQARLGMPEEEHRLLPAALAGELERGVRLAAVAGDTRPLTAGEALRDPAFKAAAMAVEAEQDPQDAVETAVARELPADDPRRRELEEEMRRLYAEVTARNRAFFTPTSRPPAGSVIFRKSSMASSVEGARSSESETSRPFRRRPWRRPAPRRMVKAPGSAGRDLHRARARPPPARHPAR